MMRAPWHRWRHAEQLAEEAEQSLDDAKREHRRVKALVDEARALLEVNGYAEAIRKSMGV